MSDDEGSSSGSCSSDSRYTSYTGCDSSAGSASGSEDRLKKAEDDERLSRAAAFQRHRESFNTPFINEIFFADDDRCVAWREPATGHRKEVHDDEARKHWQCD